MYIWLGNIGNLAPGSCYLWFLFSFKTCPWQNKAIVEDYLCSWKLQLPVFSADSCCFQSVTETARYFLQWKLLLESKLWASPQLHGLTNGEKPRHTISLLLQLINDWQVVKHGLKQIHEHLVVNELIKWWSRLSNHEHLVVQEPTKWSSHLSNHTVVQFGMPSTPVTKSLELSMGSVE